MLAVIHKANKPCITKSCLVKMRSYLDGAEEMADIAKLSPSTTSAVRSPRQRRRVHFGVASATPTSSSSTMLSTDEEFPLITTTIHTIPSNEGMDDHQRSQLWWTREERRDIHSRNQAMIQDYTRCHPLHIQHLKQVFEDECCCYDDSSTTTPTSLLAVVAIVSSEDDDVNDTTSSSSEDSDEDDESDDATDAMDDFEKRCQQRRRRQRRLHCRPSSLHALCHKRQQQRQRQRQLTHGGGGGVDVKMSLPICVRGLEYGFLPDAKSHRKVHRDRILGCQERLRTEGQHQTSSMNGTHLTMDGDETSHHRQDILEQQSMISSHRSRRLAQLLAISDANSNLDGDDTLSQGKQSGRHHDPPRRMSMLFGGSHLAATTRPRMMR